jgi:transcriptional regulator with XRE-family HTH domain
MKTLKELRVSEGISLRELAELLSNDSRSGKGYFTALSRLETGKVNPSAVRLERILSALGYELELYAVKGSERVRLSIPRAKDTE